MPDRENLGIVPNQFICTVITGKKRKKKKNTRITDIINTHTSPKPEKWTVVLEASPGRTMLCTRTPSSPRSCPRAFIQEMLHQKLIKFLHATTSFYILLQRNTIIKKIVTLTKTLVEMSSLLYIWPRFDRLLAICLASDEGRSWKL